MLPIPSFTHDLELLVYCSTELIFQVNVPMFETEVMNYIKATFTTSEVIEVISHLSTIADLVECDPIDVPFAKMTKTAPGSWQITLAGNDTILRELLGTIYQNGKYTEDRDKTLKMAKREWASCSASSSFSSLHIASAA